MEFLAPFITSLTTAVVMLSTFWIWRKTKRVNSIEFALGIAAIVYTIYHYMACGIGGIYLNPLHEIITGLFIAGVGVANAWSATARISSVNIGIDRRKEDISCHVLNIEDRRRHESLVFKKVEGHHQ